MISEVPIPPDLVPTAEVQALFDTLPDVVFFAKDLQGRYTHVNLTLVKRLGMKQRADPIGKSPVQLFPALLGGNYNEQDQRVLSGETIENQLEIHLYPNRTPGWCLTFKRPLIVGRKVTGLIGVSRDLGQPDNKHASYNRLQLALEHLQNHYDEPLRVQTLARLAGLSVAQLERHFRRVLQLTPQQLLTKLRIEAAMRHLQGDESIASIGQACGFADQSAFARQFKATVGMPPRDYRVLFERTYGADPPVE